MPPKKKKSPAGKIAGTAGVIFAALFVIGIFSSIHDAKGNSSGSETSATTIKFTPIPTVDINTVLKEIDEKPQADTSGSAPYYDLRTTAVMSDWMGSEWNDLFFTGISEVLEEETGVNITLERVTCTDETAADELYSAGEGGANAVIFAGDSTTDSVSSELEKLMNDNIIVVKFGDPVNNGYSLEDPEGLGKAIMRSVTDRYVVYSGSASCNTIENFAAHLKHAVSGLWKTGNSSGEHKQFIGYTVQEFGGEWNGPGEYVLQRVSLVTSVSDLDGDAAGYRYDLNTGNRYYLYKDDPDFLECHWEPDGYSVSDSLIRSEMGIGYYGGNSTYLLDTSAGSQEDVTLTGTVSRFTGYYNEADYEECYALNLYTPVRVRTSSGTDTILYAVQLNGGGELAGYAESGERITIDGNYWEARTAHHYTPVLLDVDQIRASDI